MTGQRKALIVANDQYEHDGMRRLLAPAADAEALGAVLSDRHVGDFAVKVLRNEPAHVIQAHIEEMFADSRSEDVLLLHFSCHGLKSESGELFFAAPNTRPNRLGSTAVSADFVQRCMRTARSRSIVLLLDCCYGGAFARGVTVRAAGDIDVLGSFPHERLGSGRGRAVITASSAMEYAFEGEQLADGEPRPSVFTTALVEGLSTGDADRDQDGWVSLNELYDYVFDKVRERNPHQTPSRAVEMQGELFIARRSRPVTTPAPVPAELLQAADHPLAGIRVGAVQELARLLGGSHAGLALGARQALERLAADDSRAVSAAAVVALGMGSVADPPLPAAEPELPAPEVAAAGPELPVVERAEPAKTESGEAPPGAEPAEVPAVPPARASAPAEVSAASPVPAAAPDLWLLSAGVLAIIAGVLAFAALYVIYAADFRLISYSSNTAQIVIGSAIALVAGLSTFVPAVSRLTSAGLLLGAAATTPGDLILTIVTLNKSGDTPGPGVWLIIIAEILLLLTAGLVVVSLIRRHYLRGVPRPPMTLASWGMVVLGVVGAAAFFFQVMNREYVPGLGDAYVKGTDTLVGPVIWITAMAVIVPLVAVRLPRPFGVALVAGWIVTALAEVPYYTGFSAGLFGYSLLALLVVLIFYARGAASHQPPGRPDPLSSAIS